MMLNIRSTGYAIATTLAFGFAFSASAQTDVKTPNYFPNNSAELLDLIKNCDNETCMSYVSGTIGGIAVYAMIAEKPSPFCARGEVGKNDIRDAIVETIESTDALLDQHPAVSILTAFSRYWPCLTQEEVDALQSTSLIPVNPDLLDQMAASDNHALILGNPNAEANRTIRVFHDPNCPHCRRFRSVTQDLAEKGWKVIIYPVATTAEESAGYGAVEIALRDQHPAAAKALYFNDPEGTADITLAMKVAETQGVPTKDILTSIARAGAYTSVEENTQMFFDMGAKGTPTWIIGSSLYSGYLNADAIEEIGASFEGEEELIDAVPIDTPADAPVDAPVEAPVE
ncbi:thioredoxin domain-containing protein [Loktanella sp. DJP18]|uniref:thioredoxin domain-containing protein n=1 Tax=Loktanella sp. DJP18 TaxID=3409788 RepID=UPI003BB5DC62